ncbi:MAG TPA: amino acid permease [Candidatus Polarisedimenticolia bacterium]|nr:amino acid permease [Candidatus Polarisedimenticolia bacterium]
MGRTREELIAQDTRDLHGLGYAQELLRGMGGFSNFAISFSIISILTGAVILFNYGLNLAGPAAVGIGWPLVTIFTLMIAATMAEIASAYPTAGGLYYWASILKNKDWGWWTAWLNLGGQVSIVAGINYAAAFYVTATIINPIVGGTFDPAADTFGVQNAIWVTGIFIAIEVVFNVAGTKIVAFMNDLSVWWHIGFVAAIAGALFLFGSQPTHDLGFLFQIEPAGTAANGTPWKDVIPFGIAGAFALSLLQAQWTYTGYDASAHVAEETVFARRASAWGVFLSVAVSAVAGYIVLVALVLKMPAPADVMANSGGYGVAYILEQNLGAGLGQLGGLLAAGVAIAMVFCSFSSIASAGRMLFAFSRDDGIPGSSMLKKVSKRWRTPSNAIIAISAASWLLILLVYVLFNLFGGDPLFLIAGITGVSTVLLYWAYGICIWLGMRGDQSWRERQTWSLGRWSRPLAWLSVIWIVVFSPLFLFPFELNAAALATVSIFLGLLLLYYFLWARSRFTGPKRQGSDTELSELEREFAEAAEQVKT